MDLSKMSNQTIKIGGGLRQDSDVISVMKTGKLRFSKPNKYWVESSQKRLSVTEFLEWELSVLCVFWKPFVSGPYLFIEKKSVGCIMSIKDYVPCVEDAILGIVVDTRADNFLVDIKGPAIAFLLVLVLEGGTRRNIPKFEPGTLVYVRVVKADPGTDPELSRTDASGRAAEFGPLKEGFIFECTTGLSRMLLSSPTCPVLEESGKKLSFEIAFGLNRRVWVNVASPSTIIVVSNSIMSL